jgi:acetylglutamate kinase
MIVYSKKPDIESFQDKAVNLATSFPWLQKHCGKKILVKVGGEILLSPDTALSFANDIVLLATIGVKVVVCHGGGPQISSMMINQGLKPQFINGQRITCKETRDIISMVLIGNINRTLVSMMNSFAGKAIGLNGTDGNMIQVEQLNPELGFVGKITHIDLTIIEVLLQQGYIPVVASIGTDCRGESYNVNADSASGELAKALGADKLILLTNTEGLYENFSKKESLISEIDAISLRELQRGGSIVEGMIPKVESILTALSGNVASCHILDGRNRHALNVVFGKFI